jgi:tRNA-uridine 2-sulfurtransferase
VLGPTGEVVGRHAGYPFYTIGQRRGLDVALGEALYVVDIDAGTNTVTVGPRSWLDGRALVARELVFGAAHDLVDERAVVAQVRYRDAGAPALARRTGDDEMEVVFAEARPAPAPGQAVVLYDGDEVLAGGWIHSVESAGGVGGALVALPILG